jgi:tRNA A37 threonylcarbamoyltransferase TsaD
MYCFLYIKIEFLVILLVITYSWLKVTQHPCNPAMIAWLYKTVTNERGGKTTKLCYVKHYRLQQPCRNIVVFPSIMQPGVSQPEEPDVSQPEEPPELIDITIPFASSTYADTKAYARHLANLVLHYQQQGKRVVIRFDSKRGGGKSTTISELLRFLTCNPTATDFGTISFIGVKQYTIEIDGAPIKVVHGDGDVISHKRMTAMHDSNWDVLLLEHGSSPAYSDHNNFIKKLGDNVVDLTVDISHDDVMGERIFTMTSATGKPIETPPMRKWKGCLIEKRFSPDIRLTKKQIQAIRKKYGASKLVVLSIESSCDDTCIIIRCGDKIIYTMQKQCLQSGQEEGKEGIDPFETAKMHQVNFATALNEIKAKLQEHNVKIDIVSVTQGPGQAFALLEGISFAQQVATELDVPIMYLDHIKGHAISPLLSSPEDAPKFPYLVFVVSGGHTVLLLVTSPVDMQIVYTTPDDAIGEVIDKICRAMGISAIPAGPVAEERMNEFLGGKKKLWTSLTGNTTIKEIESLTPVQEEREQLKEFINALKKLEECETPSQIKGMFDAMIRDLKLISCNKLDLLKEFVQKTNPTLTEKVVKGWCSNFNTNTQIAWNIIKDGKASAVLEQLRMVSTPSPASVPSFAKFLDDYLAKTPLPLEKQQFYCALLHSVLLSYLGKHFQDAIAKFPRVMHLSMAGGVACNAFLKEGLKNLLERDRRRFTVVPREYCADNAHMMWKLTMETLRYLFEMGCKCQKDVCHPCEHFRSMLLEHGCGMLDTRIDKGDVRQLARDRWDKNAPRKMIGLFL